MAIASLIQALDERTIARSVGIAHDEARMNYRLASNTVSDFDEFSRIIGDYYAYHHGRCVAVGGRLSSADATGHAKRILEQAYRRQNGDVTSAFNDARDGVNRGLSGVLDIMAESLKAEAVENYIREAFDRHVTPNSWEQKVEIIREFIQKFGIHLSSAIKADQPERYAQDYAELIRSYTQELKKTSAMFRRL